jgi:hypothetical protein
MLKNKPKLHRRLRAWAGLLALCSTLLACDVKHISELEEGVSDEFDVRARFGEPEALYKEENGARTLEYPRQPAGQVNYMITVGTDGKMSALRQVLKPANFAKVLPGTPANQVRRLLGKPAKTQRYALKQEEVWDWRFIDGQESKIFSTTFDTQGKVVSTAVTLDPKGPGQNEH